MKKFFVLSSILALFTVLIYAALVHYINYKAKQDTKVSSDAILVLGGKAFSGTECYGPICEQIDFVPQKRLNPCLVARVDHAVSLYKDGYAPKILMSGGTDKEDNINEAETMRQIALEAGVPEEDILMEKESTSTYENITFSQKVLKEARLESVIIVSDPYHNARAGLVASKLDYEYSLSPTRTYSNCSHRDDYFIREPFAIIFYKLLNRI